MIQRIQSLFLLLASGLLSGQFVVPYFTTPTTPQPGAGEYVLPASLSDGALTPIDNPGLLGLTALGVLCSIVAIFLFKNRSLQGQITGISTVVSVLLTALAAFVFFQTKQQLPQSVGSFGFGLALPVLALLCQYLAQKSIRKDENLVRSMDRLR